MRSLSEVDSLIMRRKAAVACAVACLMLGGGVVRDPLAQARYPKQIYAVPCGFSASGPPIGLQISGNHFAEATVLALAHAYEQATEWHKRRPALDVS